jgi:anti-sigma B factor antagonist
MNSTATATAASPSLRNQPLTLSLEGELGQRELSRLFERLFHSANQGFCKVVLDMTEVSHFDYRGVGPLGARAEVFRRAGGDIKLCGLTPYLQAIFRSAGGHDAFEYFPCPAEAHAAFERVVC